MSSNAAGIVRNPRADIRCVVCSKRPVDRLREPIVTGLRTEGRLDHSSVSFITTTGEEIVTDPQTDRPFDLSSVRSNESMHKESPIWHGDKSEEEEAERSKGVRFAAQTIDNQNKSSPVKIPSEDPSQVGGRSGTRTTDRKYYSGDLMVLPNSPDRGSTETSPKDKARIGLIDERNFKRPIESPETPEKQDKWSSINAPTRNRKIRGSWTTSNGQKYYLRNLAVPPNSPERGSAETTPKGETRVDVMDKRNLNPPVECPYVVQEAKKISRTNEASTATNETINHRAVQQKPTETNKARSICEMDKYSTMCNASDSDDSGSETEKKFYVARRAAFLKAWKAAEGHFIAQGKNIKDNQELPTKEDLGKKENDDDQQDLLFTKDDRKEEDNFKDEALPIKEDPGKKDTVDEQQKLPSNEDQGKKVVEDTNS
ncbi:hypothetical protein N7447_005837 [Penicillium robsamsonii]|uniref:uncharacterized protein n=1 Tax=Penicillium robsamsonii TaxID=1792511 RepID=UPI002547FB4B|nr:uncharacterized protein N7447_005837 [Penicillium robsamsonii]KAJ5823497.1 hypothetical protein N7447_005837 [Penicillium robsamsonii]